MPGLMSYGAGASEGLDTALNRMMVEAQINESKRRNLSQEAVDQQRANQEKVASDALAAERKSNEDTKKAALDDEDRRKKQEDELLKDPNTPTLIKQFVGLRRITPKGENAPYQLLTEPNGPPVNTQENAYKLTSPELAKSLGKKVGEVIDAARDPKTNKITYRGVDVTNGVDHYEKPPAVGFLQSGDGYITKTDAANKLGKGETVPLATTSSTRTMSEGASMLEPHIRDIEQQATELDKAGLFGPIMSRVRDHLGKVGTIDEFFDSVSSDPELSKDKMAGRFATSLGLLASGAGRVHGGARGGGSTQMLQYFKAMLSDASTLQMFLGRIQGVDDYMKGYAAGPGGGAAKPDAGGVPTVGGTFQGGKVLKVTPIK